jgi:Cys-rich protein (TIGR01571 family)
MVAKFVESESKSDLNSLVSKVAIAQVMERVQHTPCFRPGTKTDIFRKVRCFVFSYQIILLLIALLVMYNFLATIAMNPTMMNPTTVDPSMMGPTMIDPSEMNPAMVNPVIFDQTVNRFRLIVESSIMFAVVWYMRHHIRKKYSIPGGHCQDCCCAFFCSSCSIAQMMRHTADYDIYVSKCCTETGVPNHAPSIV